jgi:hypothetical protein
MMPHIPGIAGGVLLTALLVGVGLVALFGALPLLSRIQRSSRFSFFSGQPTREPQRPYRGGEHKGSLCDASVGRRDPVGEPRA